MDTFLSEKKRQAKQLDFLIFIQNINLRGGTEVMALNLCRLLNDADLKAKILSIEAPLSPDERLMSFEDKEREEYHSQCSNALNKFISPNRHQKFLKKILEKKITKLSPRIFVNFTYDLMGAIPKTKACFSCGVLHWSVTGYEKSLWDIAKQKNILHRWISTFVLRRTQAYNRKALASLDRLITLTNRGANEVLSLHPDIVKSSIRVIPNFIPYNKQQYPISLQNNDNVVYVGRLSSEKGVYLLLDIWKKVNILSSSLALTIYGEGPEMDKMKELIALHKIRNVIFKGYSDSLDDMYKNADLLINTSYSEGFGFVYIEAMQYGVIPLSFDCPVSPRELIGDAGILIPCFDTEAYANTIVNLLKNKTLMKILQDKCLSRAKDFYINPIIKRWKNLLKENITLS